jgi:hypothetical protein
MMDKLKTKQNASRSFKKINLKRKKLVKKINMIKGK